MEKIANSKQPVDRIREELSLAAAAPIKIQVSRSLIEPGSRGQETIFDDTKKNPKAHIDKLDLDTTDSILKALKADISTERPSDRTHSRIKISSVTNNKTVVVFRQEKTGQMSVKNFDQPKKEKEAVAQDSVARSPISSSKGIAAQTADSNQRSPQIKDISANIDKKLKNIEELIQLSRRKVEQADWKTYNSSEVKKTLRNINNSFSAAKQNLENAKQNLENAKQKFGDARKNIENLSARIVDKASSDIGKRKALIDKIKSTGDQITGSTAIRIDNASMNIGDKLKHAGRRIESAGNWLAERPKKIHGMSAAENVVKAFEKAEQRLPSNEYGLGEKYFISKEQNSETAKTGAKLHVSERITGEDPKKMMTINLDEKNKITSVYLSGGHQHFDYKNLGAAAKTNDLKAEYDKEAQHYKKSGQIAKAVNEFMKVAGSEKHSGENYEFYRKVSDDRITTISISSKDGRGKVLDAEIKKSGEVKVKSSLGAKDFGSFSGMVNAVQDKQKEAAMAR